MTLGSHLLNLNHLDSYSIFHLLQRAIELKAGSKAYGRDCGVVGLFLEPSTRTSLSFQIATNNVQSRYYQLDQETSSLKKGESLTDSLQTLEALGIRACVIRIKDEGVLDLVKDSTSLALINAGEGTRHHPTQTLIDLMTIKENFSKLEDVQISILGDIEHSRVANSFKDAAKILNLKLNLFDPFKETTSRGELDKILKESHVVMLLRNQLERHHEVKFNPQDYFENFGLNQHRLSLLRSDAIVLHPGPFMRGVELCESILDDSRVKILDQVTNGVHIRTAILEDLLQ